MCDRKQKEEKSRCSRIFYLGSILGDKVKQLPTPTPTSFRSLGLFFLLQILIPSYHPYRLSPSFAGSNPTSIYNRSLFLLKNIIKWSPLVTSQSYPPLPSSSPVPRISQKYQKLSGLDHVVKLNLFLYVIKI